MPARTRSPIPLAYEDLRERLGAIGVDTPAGVRDYAVLLLWLHTSRRLSELAGLRRERLVMRPTKGEITWVRCKGGKVMRDERHHKGPHGLIAEALVAWVLRLYGEDGRPDLLFAMPTALVPGQLPPAGAAGRSRSSGSGRNGERPL